MSHSAHTHHPDTHEHGLADDCPRCDEHAAEPWVSLDVQNLAVLRERNWQGQPARSENERKAMEALAAYEAEGQGVQPVAHLFIEHGADAARYEDGSAVIRLRHGNEATWALSLEKAQAVELAAFLLGTVQP